MNRQLEVEAIFGEMGLVSILAGKPRLSPAMLRAAGQREIVLRRRLLKFMAKDAWEPAADMVDIDYPTLLRQLSGPLSTEQTKPVFAVVPDQELAQSVCELADAVIAWAKPLIPRADPDPVTGQVVEDPPKDALLDFRRLWGVAVNPLAVLDDLADGTLSVDQVGILGQFYPQHQTAIEVARQEAIATMVARRGKAWTLGSTKRSLMLTLMGQPTSDPAVVTAMQQIYAAQELAEMQATPPPPKARRAGGPDAGAESTPGEKAASG